MSQSSSVTFSALEDRFGRAIAARLADGSMDLPHNIRERLRVARDQAITQRQREPATIVALGRGGSQAALGQSRWWSWGASALSLVGLVAGLVAIAHWQASERVAEIAEIDAALLTDDLPTAAYTDPGFMQFLQRDRATN